MPTQFNTITVDGIVLESVRYKPGKTKSAAPPALAAPAATPSEIVSNAQQAGTTEGRRLGRRTGRRATRRSTRQAQLAQAPVTNPALSTNLSGT